MSKKKNEFENFCDNLAEGEINKVGYVRNQLREKYEKNLDMLLMVKAEAKEADVMQNLSMRVSLLAIIFSTVGTVRNFIPNTGNVWVECTISIVYLVIMMLATVLLFYWNNSGSVSKWRKYVLIVIDELIEECKCMETENQKKDMVKNGKRKMRIQKNKKENRD